MVIREFIKMYNLTKSRRIIKSSRRDCIALNGTHLEKENLSKVQKQNNEIEYRTHS